MNESNFSVVYGLLLETGKERVVIKGPGIEIPYWPTTCHFEIIPSYYDFGNRSAWGCSEPVNFTLVNRGGATGQVNVTVTGSAPHAFEILSGGGFYAVSAFNHTIISVRFCPPDKGSYSGILLAEAIGCQDAHAILTGKIDLTPPGEPPSPDFQKFSTFVFAAEISDSKPPTLTFTEKIEMNISDRPFRGTIQQSIEINTSKPLSGTVINWSG
ncbi:MAG: hypothetical protein DRP09_21460 [Candidatus Thorarchaeota archaeon]|nr:MAG: hypothetical protein DRP09_21460 [Candidatus Thorarchaeota archaeon]